MGRNRLPSNLIGGVVLLAVLGLLALAAPVLATGLPWLVRSDDGLRSPAFRAYLGLSVRSPAAAVPLLRAPIPHGPSELALDRVLVSPSSSHLMGTDALGRDIAARVVHGGRVSLGVGLLAALFALVIGVPLGATAGYLRGWTDASISRLIETVLCFPTLLLVLAVLAAAPAWLRGLSDVPRIALVLGLTGWIPVARYLRGEFMKLRDAPMAQAARALGGSHLRVMVRHILPSALAPVLVTAAFTVAAAIIVEASLSFLGLGVRPPVATWGGLLADAREQVDRAWWLAVYPGVALFLAVLGCNLLGEGVRDYLDPEVLAAVNALPRGVALQIVGLFAVLLGGFLLCTTHLALPWVVAGSSMQPSLFHGDRVIVDLWTYGCREPRPGEIVLLLGPPPQQLPLVKRVAASSPAGGSAVSSRIWGMDRGVADDGLWVLGDNRSSSDDSRRFGGVPRDAVVGRVVWRYWPPSRAGRLR